MVEEVKLFEKKLKQIVLKPVFLKKSFIFIIKNRPVVLLFVFLPNSSPSLVGCINHWDKNVFAMSIAYTSTNVTKQMF